MSNNQPKVRPLSEWRVTRPEPFLERRYVSLIGSTSRNPQAVLSSDGDPRRSGNFAKVCAAACKSFPPSDFSLATVLRLSSRSLLRLKAPVDLDSRFRE